MSAAAQTEWRVPSPASRLAGWARQGVGTFVAAQNILLDLTAQQNALLIGVVRERMQMPHLHTGKRIAEMADKGVANVASVGKILLDLAAGESALLITGLKEGLGLSPVGGTIAGLIGHRIDTLIAMNKHLLETVADQTHMAVESYKDGEGLKLRENMSAAARRSVEGVVKTEKKFLDQVAEDVAMAAQGGMETRKTTRNRSKLATQIVRDGADQFIEAQKKLVDLAIKQMEGNGKGEHPEPNHAPRTSLATVTERSVHNFVSAQKSLMDLAAKPLLAQGPKAERPRAAAHGPRKQGPARKKAAKRAAR